MVPAPLNLQIQLDGVEYSLQLRHDGIEYRYSLSGPYTGSGAASVAEISPGTYSVLLGSRSLTVVISAKANEFEIVTSGRRLIGTVFDTRDRNSRKQSSGQTGPVQVKALMPGKVIQMLVRVGEQVQAGQGLVVVEAMKMQNELKSPKSGIVFSIHAEIGRTVAAGAMLLVIE